MNYEVIVSKIREQLKKYIQEHNIKSLVLGVSGGMDSCVCAALAKPVCDALGIPLIGRSLPITTNKEDEIQRAKITGEIFCTDFAQENLGHIFNIMSPVINPDPVIGYNSGDNIKDWKIRGGNIKARLRMIYLYNLASQNNGMVLSTDNYTEYLLGFWTLHGDVGDYGMIQELWKTEVYDMAEWLAANEYSEEASKILIDTINAMATDGLGVTNLGDLGQILPEWKGTSREGYKEVDRILQLIENVSARNPMHELDNHPITQRYLKTEFKRKNPYNIKRKTLV